MGNDISLVIVVVVVLSAAILGLVIVAFMRCCRLFAKAMNELPPEFRPFSGGLAWLGMIPWVGYIWLIVFAFFLSRGYKRTFNALQANVYDCGRDVAISWAIVTGISVFLTGLIGRVLGLVGLLLLARYYRKAKAMHETLVELKLNSPEFHADGNGDLQSYARPRDDI